MLMNLSHDYEPRKCADRILQAQSQRRAAIVVAVVKLLSDTRCNVGRVSWRLNGIISNERVVFHRQ